MTSDSDRPTGAATELAPAGRPKAGEGLRIFAMVALTVVLLGLCVMLAVPFLPSITWAVALAILAWPMHVRLRRYIPWPSVAAAASTSLVVALIVGIGGFTVYNLAAEAGAAVKKLQKQTDEDGGVEASMARVPYVGRGLGWLKDKGFDVEEQARQSAGFLAQYVSGLTQVSAVAAIQFLVAAFILYYLFRDPRAFLGEVQDLLPITRPESDFIIHRAGDSVHANLYATLVTGVLSAGSFGLLFWFIGLPAPVLWTMVMFVLSVLPIVGAGLIWGPAAVYLAATGRWLAAGVLVGWGLLTFVILGYFVYGRLVGQRMRMHDVPALLSFLGGLAIFGLSGMILGPAIVAVSMALIEVWKKRMADSEARARQSPT
ncbi:AI-2E family transporter [Planctomyces sp. SH-PL62]|uniref:AI-2E family transporter n=1 Tax=Planctomyces sp. SH-PL62 TaxID=1636152 RepID=UPI00078D09E9|nr:AI-2E family transporter [Planctomyces sp. SH-PL62]AMV36762.1 putative inner membrane protein [Planctomyces sp. SH-PL62]